VAMAVAMAAARATQTYWRIQVAEATCFDTRCARPAFPCLLASPRW
jgi:hypothetical protein